MTINEVETKTAKAVRLAKLGYVPADHDGKCCLCGKQVAAGQYIGKLPDGWQPKSRLRWAHRRCREALRDKIRAKAVALGVVVHPAGSVARG